MLLGTRHSPTSPKGAVPVPRHLDLHRPDLGQHRFRASAVARVPGVDGSRDELITALNQLHGLLVTHLDTEERELLPLAAAHLTPGQWAAVGEAGAAAVPKSRMLLIFGMFAYEGDPEVLTTMLHSAPPPARVIVPLLAPRIYARYAKRIHGTPRP